ADAVVGFAVLAGKRPAALAEPDRLRVAASVRGPTGLPPDGPNRQAVTIAGRALAAAGHGLARAVPASAVWLSPVGLGTWVAAAYVVAAEVGLPPEGMRPRSRRHAAVGRVAWRRGLVREIDRDRWRDRCLAFLDSYDVLMTPALAAAPPRAVAWHRRTWAANLVANIRYAPYAAPVNLAGPPAL